MFPVSVPEGVARVQSGWSLYHKQLQRQGLVFARAVNWADRRTPANPDRAQVHTISVASLQSMTEALTKEAPADFDLEAKTSKEYSGLGNE